MDRFRFHRIALESSPQAPVAGCAWLRERAGEHGLSADKLFALDLCAEELLTNIVKYAYGETAGIIGMELLLDLDTATLTLSDGGARFDPTAQAALQRPASLQAAPLGGLGVHLVHQFATETRYERCGERNRFCFRIGDGLPAPRGRERRAGDGACIDGNRRGDSDRRALGFVARTAIFRDVAYARIVSLLAHCEVRRVAAGEILFAAGKSHGCVLVCISARLEVRLDTADSKFHFDLGPGECAGEMSVADGRPNSAWVVAVSAGLVLVIPASVFLDEVLADPTIARNLIVVMSERMRRSSEQIVAQLRASMEFEALQRDLDAARQIQTSMLPASPLFSPREAISGQGFMRAARQVGGDFYDAFPIDGDRYFLAIGDVCGKGMPAALFMVRVLTLLRSLALRTAGDTGRSLAELARQCNDELCAANPAEQFVTLFCAIVDLARDRLDFVNLGHNPPLFCAPGMPAEFIAQPRNPLAGMVRGIDFVAGSRPFRSGALLMLYTDGVTEAERADGGQFGEAAFSQLLSGPGPLDATESIARTVAAVDAFAAGHGQSDDITLLAVQRATLTVPV